MNIGALGYIDVGIVLAALGLLFVIAFVAGRGQNDTSDFFLGHRKIPPLVACLSFVATEISAVTIIGVPAIAYSENWQYLQFFIGSAAARIFVAFVFLPLFFKYECTSIYEFLGHRFNRETQYAGSIFFFITRLVGSGVRLYAACLGVSVILGWGLGQTLALFTFVSIALITFGGIKAVVWSGAYQALVFYAAGISVLGYIAYMLGDTLLPGIQNAFNAGMLSVFNFKPDLNDPTTFYAGTANAFFVGLAVFGTDQELVQRLLTVETRKKSQNAIISTIFASLPMLCIYLCIGTLIYIFYANHPVLAPQAGHVKEVLSYFAVHQLPAGLKGFLLAAIILASIDSPLASLSSSFMMDIYKPLIKKTANANHYLLVSRAGIVGFGLVLAVIAYACQPIKSVLWFAFQLISITGPALLGVFLYGIFGPKKTLAGDIFAYLALIGIAMVGCYGAKWHVIFGSAIALMIVIEGLMLISRKRPQYSNIFAMALTAISMLTILLLVNAEYLKLAWSWLIVLGTAMTVVTAYLLDEKS
ncbi:MAG: hypothetical protein A2Y07_07840 [Planctomycetes bacterium GWF2_50_10]|nr:MAG: hypothetical protein A2Y07_07840 [Planctomycetes bacterium GWF2_50_10]